MTFRHIIELPTHKRAAYNVEEDKGVVHQCCHRKGSGQRGRDNRDGRKEFEGGYFGQELLEMTDLVVKLKKDNYYVEVLG